MAVTILQTPESKAPSACLNMVTLSGIGTTAGVKYVLQVQTNSGVVIADIRQTPNGVGNAIFDISNILKSLVNQPLQDVPQQGLIGLNPLSDSERQQYPYKLAAGFETAGGTVQLDALSPTLNVFLGTRGTWTDRNEVNPNYEPQKAYIASEGTCTAIYEPGGALTDRPAAVLNSLTAAPDFLQLGDSYYDVKMVHPEYFTISYLQDAFVSFGAPAGVKGIEGFRIYPYNGDTPLSVITIPNIQSEGGGPNGAPGDALIVNYPYNGITIGAGTNNMIGQGLYPFDYTHYWVVPQAWDECSENLVQLTDRQMFWPVRVEQIDASCLDYDPVQVMWTNSYGFLDYYTFRKRRERTVQIQRNEYLQEFVDYNATTAETGFRGNRVFSQQATPRLTLTTDWLTDEEARYLENLFLSPDVRISAPGFDAFQPAVLLSNTYTERTYRKDKLFQYEIQLKLDNLKTMRG